MMIHTGVSTANVVDTPGMLIARMLEDEQTYSGIPQPYIVAHPSASQARPNGATLQPFHGLSAWHSRAFGDTSTFDRRYRVMVELMTERDALLAILPRIHPESFGHASRSRRAEALDKAIHYLSRVCRPRE